MPDQLVLALEVAVDRPLRDSHRGGDLLGGGGVHALGGEQDERGALDTLAGVGMARHRSGVPIVKTYLQYGQGWRQGNPVYAVKIGRAHVCTPVTNAQLV